jgi:SWI/SNF related-matrix-associated actin-dependent regulator of chromatin subfamily C
VFNDDYLSHCFDLQVLAHKEEREIQSLVSKVIELQLKKIELKLKHFDELEQLMERERTQVH